MFKNKTYLTFIGSLLFSAAILQPSVVSADTPDYSCITVVSTRSLDLNDAPKITVTNNCKNGISLNNTEIAFTSGGFTKTGPYQVWGFTEFQPFSPELDMAKGANRYRVPLVYATPDFYFPAGESFSFFAATTTFSQPPYLHEAELEPLTQTQQLTINIPVKPADPALGDTLTIHVTDLSSKSSNDASYDISAKWDTKPENETINVIKGDTYRLAASNLYSNDYVYIFSFTPSTFPGIVEGTVASVPGVVSTTVELVWEPTWTTERMSEAAKLELGMF